MTVPTVWSPKLSRDPGVPNSLVKMRSLNAQMTIFFCMHAHAVLCNQKGDLDLLNPRDTDGYVDGVVLLCEGGEWRTVHDSNWTVEDRTVACRQLGHGMYELYNSLITLSLNGIILSLNFIV